MAQVMSRQCRKGQCLYWIFPTWTIRKHARLQCVKRHTRAMFDMVPGKMSRFARVMMI